MKRLISVVALAVSLAASAAGTKASEAKGGARPAGGVNWEGQVLKATGSGAPDMKASSAAQARLGAELAAKMDAFRNLLSQAKGLQISAGKTVGDEMAKDEVRGRVEGAIRGYRIADKRYYADQGVEIDVEVPLSAIVSALDEQAQSAAPAEGLALNTDGEAKNTGLVVDARGLKVSPALEPRLLDESGKQVYGVAVLTADARKGGPAGYFKSIDDAKKARVGDKPLVVKATKVSGSDLVISADDLKKLSEANNSYLAQGKVAILTSSK